MSKAHKCKHGEGACATFPVQSPERQMSRIMTEKGSGSNRSNFYSTGKFPTLHGEKRCHLYYIILCVTEGNREMAALCAVTGGIL